MTAQEKLAKICKSSPYNAALTIAALENSADEVLQDIEKTKENYKDSLINPDLVIEWAKTVKEICNK